jgi:hypothetical protein
MASLYEEGWRQGSIFDAELPLNSVVLGHSGVPQGDSALHHRWVIASQDCDLDNAECLDTVPCVELRPIYTDDPPTDWGIRSHRLLLTEHDYVISSTPRLHVAPTVLTHLLQENTSIREPVPEQQQAFTTWLGLRYDRPAVPANLIPLAQLISTEIARRRHRPITARLRDVLMQFDDTPTSTRVSLFAVLDDAGDEDEVRTWLVEVGSAIPPELGIVDQVEAATADGIAFSTIEHSYSADVTQLTWRPGGPGSSGAT